METLDLTKILKDCPKGTKLYSTILGDVELDGVSNDDKYPIRVNSITDDGTISTESFTNDGFLWGRYSNAECVLFPSKDCRDWSKFTIESSDSIKVGDYVILDEKFLGKIKDKRKCGFYVQVFNDFSLLSAFYNKERLTKITKFDVKYLRPFDKVLVRDNDNDYWKINWFGGLCNSVNYPYSCCGCGFRYCIPYNQETKSLLITKNDCPEFYKIW